MDTGHVSIGTGHGQDIDQPDLALHNNHLKIIQLIQKPQRRGAEIFAAQLAEGLLQSGHQVLLVGIFEGQASLPYSGKFLSLNRPMSKRLWDFRGWKTFAEIIQSFGPDIIQANAADTLKFAVFSKQLHKWKTPIVYRNANQMGDFIRGNWHRQFNQWLLDKVSLTISVSQASALDLSRTFAIHKEKHACIPIGLDFRNIEVQLTGRHFFTKKEYILQIGQLVPEKDPLATLEIFQPISQRHRDLHLVFLGSGILEKELNEKIQKLSLTNRVILIPNQPNIFPILKHAKALVMPSKIEGLPGVLLEAMYCEIPVIAYDVGGIGEILKHKQTGWLIPKNNHVQFIQGIKEVIQSTPNELATITSRARSLVEGQYHLDTIAQRFEDMYKKLV